MTTLTTSLNSICAGGGHLRIAFDVDGAARMVHLETAFIQEPITEDDLETFTRVWLKLYKKGKTLAATRTGLQAGFTVTI